MNLRDVNRKPVFAQTNVLNTMSTWGLAQLDADPVRSPEVSTERVEDPSASNATEAPPMCLLRTIVL